MLRKSALSLSAAVAALACQPPPPANPDDATATPAAGADSAATDPADAAAKDPTAEALARIPTVLDGVSAVRHLPFKAPIGAERQSTDDFRKFIDKELAKEFPPGKSAKVSRALLHAGLLTESVDLEQTLTAALVSQVGAYYDPEQAKFFVVMAVPQPIMADVINAHELTHGLQDQHYDLRNYLGEGETKLDLNADEVNARRFVVEGEATLVMSAYPIYAMQGGMLMLENEEALPIIDQQVAQAEAMTTRQMIASNAEQAAAAAEIGGDFAKAAEAMAELPPFVTVPLVVPYTRGMVTVYRVFRAGGWEAVARLYAEPPTSTEQVLHPQAKLIDARDEPVKIAIDTKAKALAGWEVIDTDTLGELMWGVYFSLWKVAEGDEAAAGWDGDQIVFLGKDDAQITLMSSRWDSADEAVEFRDGYLASLTARFGDAAKPSGKRKSVVHVPRNDGTVVTVMRKGSDVAIVDGAPDEKTGKTLATLALEAERTGG